MGVLDQMQEVELSSLTPYPGNPRRGNVSLIADSLRENTQYVPIVVQASTRYILSGNHTAKAAQSLGWETIVAVVIDVDDERARKVVLSANRTSDLATYDNDALVELLGELETLEGTGYTDEDVQALITPPEDIEDVPENVGGEFDVIVVCKSGSDQAALIARMEREGRQVRKVKSYSEV